MICGVVAQLFGWIGKTERLAPNFRQSVTRLYCNLVSFLVYNLLQHVHPTAAMLKPVILYVTAVLLKTIYFCPLYSTFLFNDPRTNNLEAHKLLSSQVSYKCLLTSSDHTPAILTTFTFLGGRQAAKAYTLAIRKLSRCCSVRETTRSGCTFLD